nr:uncharacterized protein LOC131790274 isoform X1 [Pocillopora verrucosa]
MSYFLSRCLSLLTVTFIFRGPLLTSAVKDCPFEWRAFDSSCYKIMTNFLFSTKLSWGNARSVCLGFGGDLVSITNKKEMDFVDEISSGIGSELIWIGLIDWLHDGEFAWSDGTLFNGSVYNNWAGRQPSGGEYCVAHSISERRWHDYPCSHTFDYICEKPRGKLPCPSTWYFYGSSCYKGSKSVSSWKAAKEDCHVSDGYLIKIDDAPENNFTKVFLQITGLTTTNEYVWIGLSDIHHEGRFVWEVDNSTVNFTNWAKRQPDNWNDSEDCVVVGAEKYFGLWKDQKCDRWFLYICERPASGIACFQCSSNSSFTDCEAQQVVVNCSFPQQYCFKERNSTQDDNEQAAVFYKGCTSADRCTKEKKDSVECCENNLCNKDITCHHCTSNVSFADCARKQTEVSCTLPRNRCVKLKYSNRGNYQKFYKGCAATEECKVTSDKSFVECCDDNLCNKESKLSCFKCSSTVSHDECQKRRHEHVCMSSRADRCYHASMQQTSRDGSSVTKHFEYGCTYHLNCNNTGYFFAGCVESSDACQVRCCGKNLCNEVSATGEEVPSKVNNTIVYVSLATAAGLVVLCFITGFWCYRKSHQKQMKRSIRHTREIIALDKWEILPEEIEYEEELGRGAFGVVYKATLKKRQGIEIFDPGKKQQQNDINHVVAVKELQVDSSEEQVLDFLNEISQMKLLAAHPNIVSLVGCSTLRKHKFLVLEYVPYGDLLDWLRKKRQSINLYLATEEKRAENFYEEKEPQSNQCQKTESEIKPSQLVSTEATEQGKVGEKDFSTWQLLSFAAQIARGMNHLDERGFVHRDLAARNVLVGNDNRVKVSDFGLMRQVYEDVYTIKKTKKLPIKWMAPESIYYSVFTTKSDVWSYGVLLWEMATMGGVPYPTLTNSQLCKLLKTGYLMGRPDMCSDEVYELMTECWREDPTTRPSFADLVGKLEEIMTKDVPYCDLNNYDETSPWYSAAPETSEETE